MNIIEKDILLHLTKTPFTNQRILSEQTSYSLGKVNQSLRSLQEQGYLNAEMSLTAKSIELLESHRPQRAIILAAGYGMRMIPINTETPKGLLQVNGEPLIERIIRQLHEVKMQDITVVVGFMKESYEYLIDEYQVNLLVNMEYSQKNNLHSLNLARNKIENTYIIPCDIWCEENPFHRNELYSWYMISELMDDESNVRVNRKQELVRTERGGNQMIGISYITGGAADDLKQHLMEMDSNRLYQHSFWEEALFEKDKMIASACLVNSRMAYEINTYEQLRELDESSRQLHSRVIQLIAENLQVSENEIGDITVLPTAPSCSPAEAENILCVFRERGQST